ncbi:alanine racemase [Sporosarcina siberiensis]|uniref:Alanine racemase n=1 Tax=Sporosarcina siberiensis TaxID=1365606 RepID=A0ABW4SDD9_9BACL
MKNAEIAYAHLTRPLACIDLDVLDRNIAFINQKARGKDIRIATKSVRSIELLRYIGERIEHHSGWMTFDLYESLYLLEEGFDHLLLGYPQLEELPMISICRFIREGRTIIFMVDCIEQWQWLDKIGEVNDVLLNVCIDINVSTDFKLVYFGTKRSSLTSIGQIKCLLDEAKTLTNTKLTGVMGYEAQIAGVTDIPNAKYQIPIIKLLKKKSSKKVRIFRKNAVDLIKSRFSSLSFVNGGGSGSIEFTSGEDEVTELTIGSAFYFPALFSRYESLPLEAATTFALRVTRKPEEGIVVCHGGGYIASGATGSDKNPVPIWPKDLSLLKNEGAGEVQTPLLDSKSKLKIGDTVYFSHAKAGELCERFTELHARRGSDYVKPFKTYRGHGGCYL